MTLLSAESRYVLTPIKDGAAPASQSWVLGPFDTHRQAWLERCAWAYDSGDAADSAELRTGAQLAADYQGRYGALEGAVALR